jgi:hypothetical protein
VASAVAATAPLAWADGAFQEAAGQVVMEAEHFASKTPRNAHDWLLRTSITGYAGTGYMESSPNSATTRDTNYLTNSPELIYNVQVTNTGTYYVWVRGSATSGNDDSIHVGLDGAGPASADRLTTIPSSWGWTRNTMDGSPATLNIATAGLHTIHIWMREDGSRLDRILLRKSSSSTAPSGSGPAESPIISTGDTSDPTVSMTAPANGAIVGGHAVQVSATASDNVGVVGVQFLLDGMPLGPEDTAEPYTTTWDAAAGSAGAHQLSAQARDAAGRSAASPPITVTVDKTPPVVTITSPADGAVIVAPES